MKDKPKPVCDVKLVHLSDRKSIAPGFNLYTDVPLPGRFWGLTVDDLNFSSNSKSTAYGEKLPVAFNPVGIYDYTNRLIYTVESDYNGLWDVLLPSTNRISCPTPSGVCANLYRFVGNDPGTPGHWNPNYDPQYRTIAAEFEAFPGLTLPADLAPFPVSVAVQIPGSQALTSIACTLNDPTGATPATNPEFFAINKPWMRINANQANRTFTITGNGLGNTAGTVKLDNFTMTILSWSNTQIQFRVPNDDNNPNRPNTGPHQLKITTAGGKSTVNALTFHVLNSANSNPNGNGIYNPNVYEVGPGNTYTTIQSALEAAAGTSKALVVVYPGAVDPSNPRYNGRGAYYENLIIHSPVKLQGVGPGGVYPNGTPVQGTIIDGIAFGGDTALADAWRTLIGGLTWAGNQDVSDGEVIYVLPGTTTQFSNSHTNAFDASIDGLDIRGGDQMGFPGNLNAIFGGFPGPAGAANTETQGGAIFANSFANYLQITNNIVENNGGTYGTIRIGTPNIDASLNSNQNVRIANNRIIANGGTNLAGAIGLFGGSDNYEVASNDICGNFSAEYGGAISHFGRSNNGSIHDNRIYFNHSYDEGAGIMIAGELATVPTANYGQPGGPQGSGAVNIYNNLIQGNMSEDDGGGLRFLMAGNFPMNVYNNMIVNNIATHEGGGAALDDAPNVRFFNNTVMNNKTTATAITSNGQPAPAGLSTGSNSDQLQATLPGGSPAYSNPLLFNNIFYNNWAGAKGTNTVTGIGIGGPGDINRWDMGVVGTAFQLSPTNSILQSETVNHNDVVASPTNKVDQDPLVASTLDIPLSFTSWRTNINFIGAIMVTADLPPQLLSDYHLSGTSSSAYNAGAASKAVPAYQQAPATLAAPAFDIDNQGRPAQGGFDSGADEIPNPTADLSITMSHAPARVYAGGTVTYTITVSNAGPNAVTSAIVTDNFPYTLTVGSWTCTASAGSSCTISGSGNNRGGTVTLLAGGSASFIGTTTLAVSATGTLSNLASVAAPTGIVDPVSGNNSVTDSTSILAPPSLSLRDNFNRTNSNNLGANWNQAGSGSNVAIRINGNQAFANTAGKAMWSGSAGGGPNYSPNQGAAFIFANAPVNNSALILKATAGNGSNTNPQNYIRVRYNGGQVIVETTNNGNAGSPTFTPFGTFNATFASGDRITAVANSDSSVMVFKTSGSTTTLVGTATVTGFTGSGRIGIQLPAGARVDDFSGGSN